MRPAKTKQKILAYLAERPNENAFLRREFDGMAESRSGVDKAIRALIREGVLVRCGFGVLVRGMYNQWAGRITPEVPMEIFAEEALRKLGVPFTADSATQAYNRGETTQELCRLKGAGTIEVAEVGPLLAERNPRLSRSQERQP